MTSKLRPLSPCTLAPDFDFISNPEEEQQPESEESAALENAIPSSSPSKAFFSVDEILSQVNNHLHKYLKTYNKVMNGFLPSNGLSINPKDLHTKHESTSEKLQTLFESDLQPVVLHFCSLFQNLLRNEFVEIENVNQKRIHEETKLRRELEKQEKKREAEERLRKMEEEKIKKDEMKKSYALAVITQQSEKPETAIQNEVEQAWSSLGHEPSSTPQLAHKKKLILTAAEEKKELPRIVMAFDFTHIKVGYDPDPMSPDETFEVLENDSFGEKMIPTYLTVSKNGDVLIGTEAKSEVERNSVKRFFLGELILNINVQRSFYCFVDGELKLIEWETLCAIFLRKLKFNLERQLDGRWTEAVISVPLCFTYMQRLAIAEAARLAGFERVRTVKDIEVTAHFLANNTATFRQRPFVVVFSSQFHFDAALFQVKDNYLVILANCGNFHSSFLEDTENIVGDINIHKSNWFNWIVQNEEQVSKQLRDLMHTNVDENQDLTIVYIDSSGTNYLKGIIDMLGGKSKDEPVPTVDNNLVIKSASAFCNLNNHPNSASNNILITRTHDDINNIFPHPLFSAADSTVEKVEVLFSDGIEQFALCGDLEFSIPLSYHKDDKDFKFSLEQVVSKGGKIFPYIELIIYSNSCDIADVNPDLGQLTYINGTVVLRLLAHDTVLVKSVQLEFEHENGPELKDLKEKSDYNWNYSVKVGDKQHQDFNSILEASRKDEKNAAVSILQELVVDIESKLAAVKSMIGRKFLESGVIEAKALLLHPKMTREAAQRKIDVLSALKRKYIPIVAESS